MCLINGTFRRSQASLLTCVQLVILGAVEFYNLAWYVFIWLWELELL